MKYSETLATPPKIKKFETLGADWDFLNSGGNEEMLCDNMCQMTLDQNGYGITKVFAQTPCPATAI